MGLIQINACVTFMGGGLKITPKIWRLAPTPTDGTLSLTISGLFWVTGSIVGQCKGQGCDLVDAVFSPHAGPSGAYSPDAGMGYMMDGQAAQMMHRAPGDAAFHNEYHYPAQYYGHHL